MFCTEYGINLLRDVFIQANIGLFKRKSLVESCFRFKEVVYYEC